MRDPSAHLLTTLELGDTGVKLLASQRVSLPLPTRRVNVAQGIRVELFTKGGQISYRTFIDDPRPLRGEFAKGDAIEPVHIERATATFVLRLPLTEDAEWIRFVSDGKELGKLAYRAVKP